MIKYYEISESTARAANNVNSFSTYKEGSATENYKNVVDRIHELGEQAKTRVAEERFEHIDILVDRYAKKYAEYLNKGFRIESYYPSVMITGAGNFNTRKKEKQNNMRDNHYKNYEYFTNLENKIKNFGSASEILKSNDPLALEKLEQQMEDLKVIQQMMKDCNAYYRKHNNIDGFFDIGEKEKASIIDYWNKGGTGKPFESFELTGINNKIKTIQGRITQITRLKETATTSEYDISGIDIITEIKEDAEDMRIRLFFDGKPSAEVRTLLKSNAFKYSPKNEAWQRQLTSNARNSTKQVLIKLREMGV